jgi:hypothetical protein
MEISGAGKQEEVSAWVESIRAKARAKRASHLELFGILGDRAVATEAQGEQEASSAGSCDQSSPNKGMVSGDKAEAARSNLGDNAEQVSLDHCA